MPLRVLNPVMTLTNSDFGFELPGYTLLREIGRGGVSTVYLARHELLGREVAIKVMSPVLAVEQGFNKRFIREGRTVAQLKHPGIVTVYDVAVSDHRPFIAMEYLPGGSLKDRIHSPIPPHEAIAYLRTIADSLGYAHSRGVFHRDVKPENILFRDNGQAVLTDFGIAKSESQDTALTSVGVVVGTPRYISPEQAQGDGSDARSDIYALGVILHEMLTGKPPYDVKGSMSLLYAHINEPIPRLPEELADYQRLLDDLLAKDPAQRIADCALLAKRLDQPDKPIRWRWLQRSRRRADRTTRPARRRAMKWPAVALTVFVAAVAGLLLWTQGYLTGSGWGPESGRDFRKTVTQLVEPAGSGNATPDSPPARGGERSTASAVTELLPPVNPPTGRAGVPEPENEVGVAPENEVGVAPENEIGIAEEQPGFSQDTDAVTDPGRGLDAESLYNQAQALLSGRLKEENLVAAAELHEQAAEKGHAMAQYYLGVAFGNGDGVPRDESLALRWLQRAADSGVRGAQYNMILARIFGSNPDTGAAARSALALAEQNYAPVYRILGWMYNTGTGVDSSFAQSVRWSAKTMMGDITGKAGTPRWVVRRWQRRLEAELGKIRESKQPPADQVVK